MTESQIIKLWCPVQKGHDGEYSGILSDTSMDRDGEFMSAGLLKAWAQNNVQIKALADHENKMRSWVGGWTELKTIEKGGHTALVGKPWFFDKDANPLAEQIRNQVDQSLKRGMGAGISISAIVKKAGEKEIDGKTHKEYQDAELLEATWVPLQSNRNATYGHVAKQFGIDVVSTPGEVEDCVRSLMADPDFKPQEGRTKEESAYAVCQSRAGGKAVAQEMEVQKMSEEEQPSEPAPAEEASEEAPAAEEEESQSSEEPESEEESEEPEKSFAAELEALKKKNEELEKEIKSLKETPILKAKIEPKRGEEIKPSNSALFRAVGNKE